ncbi:hypothetical protein PN36_10800 [Candidatus Thiomargarita nelsonii]|uniref:Uncharacterized protein n=1 Tax=Candidatus Thiomargarita nelsonii TaxID=1003181 RepID=A0A4E0QQ52_9GAMM|nr:hypothetical protein PN36_10800 [Candidatus Thiomargarita nelsonii]
MRQKRSYPQHRARVIAANNILNALFMVVSALGTVGMLQAGFSIAQIFLSLGLLNAVIVGILFMLSTESGIIGDFGVQSFSFGRGFPKLKLWTPKYLKIIIY